MLVNVFHVFLVVFAHELTLVNSDEYPAPIQFTEEPKNIQFSNRKPGYLHCRAKATSSDSNTGQISIGWRYSDGSLVENISRTILALPNGTLWFPPFQNLKPRIHQGKFQCVAKLSGLHTRAILSRVAVVNGVITKPFNVIVKDQYLIGTGGTAMFTCLYPKQVISYVKLKRWWIDKEVATPEPSGHLIIHNVQYSDSTKLYYCVVFNVLAGEVIASNVAKLFILKSSGISNIPFQFNIQPVNKTISVGKPVLLECLATRKYMEYTWKHNDKDIRLNHHFSLVGGRSLNITNSSLTDMGKYTCVVRDKITNKLISADAYLSVQVPLTFRARPVKIFTSYNLNVTFQCEISGYPRPIVMWYKDAKEIQYSRKKVREGNNLIVTTAWGKDEGIYQCIASNGIDTIHQAASLIVGAQPPMITKSFKKTVLDHHAKLDISCEAVGDRKPDLSWYRDGKLIEEGLDSRIHLKEFQDLWTLQIRRVTAADSGIYRCEAKNRAGTNFSEAEILIKGPAKITYITQNVTKLSGRNVNITCSAKGYPVLKISWLDSNKNVLPNLYHQSITSNGGTSILTIKNVGPKDKGYYKCTAESNIGPADYSYAYLNVYNAPETRDGLKVKEEGSTMYLMCRGSKWEKDGKSVKSHPRIEIKSLDKEMTLLKIINITANDAGNYLCIKTTDAGVHKQLTEIIVITRPRFTNQHKPSQSVLESKNAQLLCPVSSGFPTPRVEWQRRIQKSFKPIPESPRFLASLNGSLTILNVTAEDETDYSCIACNPNTYKESRTTKLNVNVPAKIINWLMTTSTDAGNTTQLDCNATGNQKLIFTWFKNGQKIYVNGRVRLNYTPTSSHLIIKRTISKDGGSYTCEVKNSFGKEEKQMTLKIRDKPHPPVVMKHIASKRSITIFWKVGPDGNSPIMSFHVAFKKISKPWNQGNSVRVPSNQNSSTITGLQPYTSYNIRVQASNRLGLSNASKDIRAETKEDSPSAAPTSIKIIPGDKSFGIQWKRLRREFSNGVIQGYVIRYRKAASKSNFKKKNIRAIDGTETRITQLEVYTRYEIMVQACTKQGCGPNSSLMINRTEEGVPSKPPTNISVTVVNSTSIYLSWDSPSKYSINGKLVGYRVIYKNIDLVDDRRALDIGSQTNITLGRLGKFSHYSVKVAARTSKGVGKTGEIKVWTKQDIPGTPRSLTAIVTSVHSIKLEWNEPVNPNGIIIAYRIYYVLNQEDTDNKDVHSFVEVSGKETSHEFENMTENRTYFFWISAKTIMGEGSSTRRVTASTSRGPPVFKNGQQSSVITAKWKTDVSLVCKFTGVPTPIVTWLNSNEKPLKVQDSNKYNVTHRGKLVIRHLRREDSQIYICKVTNELGSIKRRVTLKVQAPPFHPQNIRFSGINSTAVKITWTSGFDGNSVITNYTLQYRRIDTDWKDLDLDPHPTEFDLNNIHSGKRYFFRMRASNEIGRGNFSASKKMKFLEGATLEPIDEFDMKDEVEHRASSKIFYEDSAVLGTLIGVCLFIVIVIVVLVLLTKLGFNPGTKLVQRSVDSWRRFVGKRNSSEGRRRKRHRTSGGSSTDGHLGGSSSSLSQPASNAGSQFSLPRTSSRVTESGYITSFFPIPLPFSNYTPGSNNDGSVSGSSDEGIGPEIRGDKPARPEPSDNQSQSSIPQRSSNGTPDPPTLIMSPLGYSDPEYPEYEATSSSKRPSGMNMKRSFLQNRVKTSKSKTEEQKAEEVKDVSPNLPIGKERVFVQSLGNYAYRLPGVYNQHSVPMIGSPQRPKYEDGHFIIGPDVDQILAYRPPRCYDSTSSEYSSSRDELAQAYEFGKLHHLDDFYGRPTLESSSSSGETASSDKDGICHFTTDLSVGRPFLIPVAILPPPPNQRQRSRDRNRNIQPVPLKTYYEKDETLV